jgi:hypothetical protein
VLAPDKWNWCRSESNLKEVAASHFGQARLSQRPLYLQRMRSKAHSERPGERAFHSYPTSFTNNSTIAGVTTPSRAIKAAMNLIGASALRHFSSQGLEGELKSRPELTNRKARNSSVCAQRLGRAEITRFPLAVPNPTRPG